MGSIKRLASVAVAGPLRKTFAYHLPDSIEEIARGQRVLVEFGRRRTVGFYLGEPEIPIAVETKPILRTLDTTSYFPPGLFDFCRWIADYYFANPADCLSSALPPMLKTRRSASLVWSDGMPSAVPADLKPFFRTGKRVSQSALELLRRKGSALLAKMIRDGVINEVWPEADQSVRQIIVGYRAMKPENWAEFFQARKFQPQPFDGHRSRAELKNDGWSEHYLRLALNSQFLEPVFAERPDRILDFVHPREDVTGLQLTIGQKEALERLTEGLGSGFSCSLLHGITGSGKTLVYCHLARKVLDQNRGVLVLTPEIALSGSALAYFRGFFGDNVTVIHSAMTGRERLESWTGIRRGKYRVVIGPRSALFAPLENPGLVIVDEEHDSSYKQNDPSPRFHGRDAAVMRGKLSKVPVLLGSASPSLESYHHARSGRYRLLELTERPAGARLPKVRVINMQQQKLLGDMPYLSFPLKKEVDSRLTRDEQVILFLNRRGYAPQLKCTDCGFVPRCPHCDVKLTYHRVGRKLSCHYCGHFQQTADSCPACSGHRVLYLGAGTQKVETHLAQLFRSGRVLRFDSDTASGRKNAHQMLREFSKRDYNLLLGTQMVTKGLDFPGVSLVGVLSADLGLDLPDFRASEKTFARLLQVAGRSGRGQNPGEVFIQTYYPDSEVIRDAAAQDFVSFYEREIESRRTHRFPPFNRLFKLILLSQDRDKLETAAADFGDRLRVQTQQARLRAEILGPAPCPMALLRGNFRRQLFVKTKQPVRFSRMLSAWEHGQPRFGLPTNVKIVVDVDPDDMM